MPSRDPDTPPSASRRPPGGWVPWGVAALGILIGEASFRAMDPDSPGRMLVARSGFALIVLLAPLSAWVSLIRASLPPRRKWLYALLAVPLAVVLVMAVWAGADTLVSRVFSLEAMFVS